MDQICFEVDYPHADSTFPHTKEVATRIVTNAGLDADETYKLLRGNAIEGWGLHRFELWRSRNRPPCRGRRAEVGGSR